jgi:anti-sigma-K factor RskA
MTDIDPAEIVALRALDALPENESRAFDDKLPTKPAMRAQLSEIHEVIAILTEEEHSPAAPLARLLASLPGTDETADESLGPATVITIDPSKRDRTRRLGIAAMAVAAAAVLIVLLVGSLTLDDGATDPSLNELASTALDDPDTTKVTLARPDGTMVGRAAIQLDGAGFIVFDDLGELGDGNVFQLWQLSDGDPVSIGILGDDGVAAIQLGPDATGVAVSIENENGAVTPTADQIIATGAPV